MRSRYNLDYFSGSCWSFVLIKQNRIIYKSKLDGLKPLIFCIKKYSARGRSALERKNEMQDSIVYDKIIGKAAAILLVSVGISEVWTPTISKAGKAYLSKNNVKIVYKNFVNCIKNRKGNDICPMEKMARKIGEKGFIDKMLA